MSEYAGTGIGLMASRSLSAPFSRVSAVFSLESAKKDDMVNDDSSGDEMTEERIEMNEEVLGFELVGKQRRGPLF